MTARRPDVVAFPDRSICCYAADKFDETGEVDGVRKLLIVELKRGGFHIGTSELRQGEDYAIELQKANLISKSTEIVVCVLGAKVSEDANEERTVGKTIRVLPMTYETILKRAHARTFNLQRKLLAVDVPLRRDEDVEEVVGMPLFDTIASSNLAQPT